jgi:hypothetical protein
MTRTPQNMSRRKYFIVVLLSVVARSPVEAGDVTDLGESRTVPDWAVGPLLVVPVERIEDRGLKVPRSETRRIGTLQANYLELGGKRHRLASIRRAEISNDSHVCCIKTVPDHGRYFEIHLSQSLFDQTFYYFHLQTTDAATDQPIERQYWAVWDAKSRVKSR